MYSNPKKLPFVQLTSTVKYMCMNMYNKIMQSPNKKDNTAYMCMYVYGSMSAYTHSNTYTSTSTCTVYVSVAYTTILANLIVLC